MAKARSERSGCLGAGHEGGAQMKIGPNRKFRLRPYRDGDEATAPAIWWDSCHSIRPGRLARELTQIFVTPRRQR